MTTHAGTTRFTAHEVAAAIGAMPPTDEQRAVIEAPLEPTLVVAGAGAGKTETMSLRIVWLVANGLVAADQILGLTFTRKAAGELDERVRTRLRAWDLAHGAGRVAGAPARSREAADPRDLADPAAGLTLAQGVTVSTYNSYAASVVRDHALRLGRDPDARLLTEGARWHLAHEIIEGAAELTSANAPSTLTKALLALSDAVSEHLLEPGEAAAGISEIARDLAEKQLGPRQRGPERAVADAIASLETRTQLLRLVSTYQDLKRRDGLMDFADQVALADRLAALPAVRALARSRFSVVILDEYQDTSVAQLHFLAQLYGGGHPVMAVGDPQQAIYGWRGASAGGLEGFPEDFCWTRPGQVAPAPADVLTLSTAWRNDHVVLDAANTLARPLRAAADLEVPLLRARPGAGSGEAAVAFVATAADEARAVAEHLVDRWLTGRADLPEADRPSAAVLCRKRSQFALMATTLRAHGIPVEVVGLGGLLSTPEVSDVVAALEAAHDPGRGDSLMRLLTSARLRLGLADVAHLGDWAATLARRDAASTPAGERAGARTNGGTGADRSVADSPTAEVEHDDVDTRSIVDALDTLPRHGWQDRRGHVLSDAARDRLGRLAGVLREIRGLTYLPVADLVIETERLLGLDIEVAARGDGAHARAHLDRLVAVAEEFASGVDASTATLGAFLAWLEDAAEHDKGLEPGRTETTTDAVQVLTVHAAKGLEWDHVVVPGMVKGTFPSRTLTTWATSTSDLPYPLRGDGERLPVLEHAIAHTRDELTELWGEFKEQCVQHELMEERRVAYVAVTRARRTLLLTGCWWRETGAKPTEPSVFLRELVTAGIVPDDEWQPQPAPDETNPALEHVEEGSWPIDPLDVPVSAAGFPDNEGTRRQLVEDAASRVRAMLADLTTGDEHAGGDEGGDEVTRAAQGPWASITGVLLAERRARDQRARTREVVVTAPAELSASAVVAWHEDPESFATDLRRPVPRRPSTAAGRGTEFHRWVEVHYGSPVTSQESLDGLDDSADPDVPDGLSIDELVEGFRRTEWADRKPVAVEVEVVAPVGDRTVRTRIDAVFVNPDGRYVVVDWKTGREPKGAELADKAVQLGVYRIAWARHVGVATDDVDAVFCYVATGRTVRPENLPDEAALATLLATTSETVTR